MNTNALYITSKTNDLTETNNDQYKINQYLTKTTNKILDGYNKILDEMDRGSTGLLEQTLFNKLGIIKDEISKIVMATQLAKKGIIHSQILNKGDIANILSQTETLPFKNELQALKYAEPAMIAKDLLLLYVISLPKTEDILYDNIIIRSSVKNNKKIHLEFTNLFVSQHERYGIKEKCLEIDDTTICKRSQTKKLGKDHCISQIFNRENALCDYQYENKATIELITEGTIFLSNFIGNMTYSTTSIFLNGTYIVNFLNETITLNNVSYSNWQTSSYQILPPILQTNLTENQIKLDLEYLHQLHLTNLKRIDHVSRKNIISISSSFAAILLAVFLTSTVYFYLKHIQHKKTSFYIPPIIDHTPIATKH